MKWYAKKVTDREQAKKVAEALLTDNIDFVCDAIPESEAYEFSVKLENRAKLNLIIHLCKCVGE